MTYDESTLFMKFMQGKGVMNNFEYLYRSHRFDKKKDLERYMDDVDAEDVILSAFDMSGAGNTIFGVKYWQEINDKWQAKLTEFRNTGILTVDEAMVYCPHCQRVLPRTAFAIKANMQLHKHCRECEGGKWDRDKKEREKAEKEAEKQAKAMKQLEKEIAEKKAKLERLAAGRETVTPLSNKEIANDRAESARREIEQGQANLNKTTKVCAHCGNRKLKSEFDKSDTSEDGLQSWCRKCQTAAANVSMQADFILERQEKRKAMIEKEQSYMVVKETEEEVAEQQAVQPVVEPEKPAMKSVRPDKLVAPKLGEYDATLHYKQQQKSLTLNATLSAQIREGEFTKCYLNIDRSKHAFLIFNRVEGANVTGASSLTQALLNVTSADIARTLAARFDLDLGENYYLHITKNLSKKDEFLTVEVLAARSREEYIKIAERRELAAKGNIPPYEADGSPKTFHEDKANNEDEVKAATLIEDKAEETAANPLLDFGDGESAPPPAEEVIQMIIDRHLVTDRDLAVYLHKQGWELQEPVIVKKMKKFSL